MVYGGEVFLDFVCAAGMCLEKRAFYRMISGLHTSINIHLCDQYLLPGQYLHHHIWVLIDPTKLIEKVSTSVVVVMVVVMELFSLVTSAICVWIRGHRSEVTMIVYHMAQVFVYCCILTTGDS